MRKSLCLVIAFLSFYLPSRAQVIYSVQAHQDDFVLFMSSRVVNDLTNGASKVVFITLTAGDQGCSGCQYYQSRERGAVYASKYLADLTTGSAPLDVPTLQTVTINSHTLFKYSYKNTVNYFFRLPDGSSNGLGFPGTGNVSLQKLYQNTPSGITLTSIGQTGAAYTYTWSSLVATIRAIIYSERDPGSQGWLHSASLNTTVSGLPNYNVGDHSDHLYTATAAQAAVPTAGTPPTGGFGWVGITEFMDYYSQTQASNLSDTEHENAAMLFAATTWAINEDLYQNEYGTTHFWWLPMDYYSVKRSPINNAPFANPGGQENETGSLKNIPASQQERASLIKIPMLVSMTGPITAGEDIKMVISPFETGQLAISVYDKDANKAMTDFVQKIEKRDPLTITLPGSIKSKGNYVLKLILNDKYTESIKFSVE